MIGIILFRPEKPANLGNIMRTCVASETKLFVIGPLTFTIDDKSLKRAGMDYINELNFKYYENYEEFLKEFKNNNIFYVTRYSKNVYSKNNYSSLTDDYYFMFGRESTGIPHEILLENIDKTIRIPMAPSARSLNLSNSVAIVLYEALRQENYPNLATQEEIKGNDFLIEEKTKNV
jgi:tRNA (cytidine/uridine-2'-O-)-methyltransferase